MNETSFGIWPYNVWSSISITFNQILNENDSTLYEIKLKKCTQLLDHIPKNSKCLVPVKNPHSEEYRDILEDCKCFNTWLFGQIIALCLRDSYKNLRPKCSEAQITLLHYLWNNDPIMYSTVIRSYIDVLQSQCIILVRDNFKPSFFTWFKFTWSNPKFMLPEAQYRVNSYSQAVEFVNMILMVFTSQIQYISNLCSAISSSLWNCSLLLWQEPIDSLKIYKFVSHLLRYNILPDHKMSFCTIISEILQLVLNDVSVLCQKGKLQDEENFCLILNALSDKICSDTCFDYSYVHTLYYLLLQCPSTFSGAVEDALIRFFTKLLHLGRYTSEIKFENNLSRMNFSILVALLHSSIAEDIQQIVKRRIENVDVYQCNKHWRYLLSQTIEFLQTVIGKQGQAVSAFKLVRSITRLTVDVSYQCTVSITFFNNELQHMINTLIKIFEVDATKRSLRLLLEIVKDVLMLSEIRSYNDQIHFSILSLLTLSWLPSSFNTSLSETFCQKYSLFVDDELREFCIASLMWTYRFQFEKWRDLFFIEIIKRSSRVFESLPVLIHSLNDYDLEVLLNYLLSSSMDTLTKFSSHIRFVTCAIDSQCVLLKLTEFGIRLHCVRCDKTASAISVKSETNRMQHLNRLIVQLMKCSEESKYHVISAAVNLFNHMPKTENLLNLLQGCFASTNCSILTKIIEITPYIIFNDPDSESPFEVSAVVFRCFVQRLQTMALEALLAEDADTQYVCLNAITKIGCVPLELTLLPSVFILLNFMLNPSSACAPLAKSCMQQIAIAHHFEEEYHVYLKYHERVFPLVAQIIVQNFSVYKVGLNNFSCEQTSILNNANHVLTYLLPYVAKDPELRPLIDDLANLCKSPVPQLLRNAFKHVLPHVMLFEPTTIAKKVMEIIYKETDNTIADLLSCCVTKVLANLFIHYEEYEEEVKWVLSEIKILATPKPDTSEKPSESSIESFLKSRFFGVLMNLENQMGNIMCNSTRRRVLSSFKSLIRFMSSSYITSIRFKVLFTLRTITNMEKNSSSMLCIDIWDTFVRKVENSAFGPILSNIFVSLLPFTKSYKAQVNAIFRYLIIENGNAISDDHLLELYFLEQHQCDGDIFSQIKKAQKQFVTKSLDTRLEWLLEATKHEVTEIKLHALRRLKYELATNREDISRLILASDSVNRLVFRVLDILVEGFRNLDVNIQQASGMCLGEFGAIDPSYIPNTVIKEDDSKKYNCYQIDDVEFVVNAFTALCRGFQMAKTSSSMDMFALAIQSLLNKYEVTQTEECRYWRKIPAHLREIIQPFSLTTYKLLPSHGAETNQKISHLVYSVKKDLTVQKWAYNWSAFLISLLPQDSKAKEVFMYCKGPMSCEISCIFLFLPHILLSAVLASDDENLTKIYEEMISVVKHDPNYPEKNSATREQTSTQLVICEELSSISNTDMEIGVICTKTIFNLLDVLNHKFRTMRAGMSGRLNTDGVKLHKFLSKFNKLQLAQKSFDRKEYVRSLLYLEEHLSQEDADFDRHLVLLAKIYVQLNDVDNVKGLFAIHTMKLSQLQNVIMLHEITDQFQDAAICYQQLLKTADEERALYYEKRMIQCYLAMNQPETALRFVNSLSAAKTKHAFSDVECEALWNLSQYDKLEKLTASKSAMDDDNWGVRMGQSIIHFLKGNRERLCEEVHRIRGVLTKSLHMSTAAFGGYRECYEHAVKLHILNELEKISELVFCLVDGGVTDDEWRSKFTAVIQVEFSERLNKLQPTSRVLQPVLNMRQVLFTVAGHLLMASNEKALFNEEIRRCWLRVIEIANRTRNFQLAYSNIIAIDNCQLKGFFIEKAKYYWEKMEQQEALRTLQHGLHFHYPDYRRSKGRSHWLDEDRKICAEALMLLGTYNDTVANADSLMNLENFRNANQVFPQSEKTLAKFAQYQEKIISVTDMFAFPKECVDIVKNYGKSLTYGCEFIYPSLSKMLNILLDMAERLSEDRKQRTNENLQYKRSKCLREMIVQIRQFLKVLPPYYFMTTFSLVMSRFLHPIQDCFDLLQCIIIRCIHAYPNQALWQFMSLYRPPGQQNNESAKRQSDRVSRILNHTDLANLSTIIHKFDKLFKEFSLLCLASKQKPVSSGRTKLTVLASKSFLLTDGFYDSILIPAQKFLTIVLPRSANDHTYNPYPEKIVNIAKVQDEAFVYSSMQKPVRITLVGTDGRLYPMIFKAMDDLRIDSGAMEFNAVVNMYLKRDAEARDRFLRIRTYTVLPLLGTNGLIEFIPNLDTMRTITLKMRRNLGLGEINKSVGRSDLKDSIEKKRADFQLCVTEHKPVLHEWFKMEFPNPSSWYIARTSYVRTLAVMSVVGYVLGLGDRHNDNILLDQTNGDVVHVDFNALFNKGETLQWPERVPFRLTHSMIKAMGPLGYEGCFRCTCEIVNRIVRSRKDQLISVLNTFRYDPSDVLSDAPRSASSTCSNRRLLAVRAAAEKLKDVEARMNGVVRVFMKNPSIPLSIEGQINRLIEEATDEDNLCQMFYGWAAYM